MGQAGDVREDAPAKLTLSLRITGVAPDGYHLLDAEMVTLDLCDTLEFRGGNGIDVEGECAAGVPRGEENLVVKALRAAGQEAHVTLEKRIPAGAGLGGGSADAAAALRWAGCEDLDVAAGLGSDVPFCLVGGHARVTGTGGEVASLPHEDRTFTLVIPPFGMESRAVYEKWDELGGPTGEAGNDLEPAAVAFDARLLEWRDALGAATGVAPRLAGSGSTWFVEGAFTDHELSGARVCVVRTIPRTRNDRP